MTNKTIWNSISLAGFFLKNYRKSNAFRYIITLFFLIGLLMSVLSIFFLNSIVSEFVPGSIKIIHYPTQILEDIYNFAWASIAIYLPVLAVAFFGSGVKKYLSIYDYANFKRGISSLENHLQFRRVNYLLTCLYCNAIYNIHSYF